MEEFIKSLPTLLAIVTSFVSIFIAVSKNKAEVRKLNLEGESSVAGVTEEVAESARLLLEPLNDRISRLKGEVDDLRKRNQEQDAAAQRRLKEREIEIAELKKIVILCATAREETLRLLDQVEAAVAEAKDHIDSNGHTSLENIL